MKFTYSTNMMGPTTHWYETNNIPFKLIKTYSKLFNKEIEYKHYEPWYGGRIDIYDTNYPDETGLPIMSGESYGRFSQWLDKFSSTHIKSFEEIIELIETKTNFKLIIFEEI